MAASSCFMVTFRAVHPLRNSVTSGASALDFHFLLTGFGLADGPLQRATPPPASAWVKSWIVQDKFEIAKNIIQLARRYLIQGFDLVYAENMVNDLIPEKA